MNDVPSTWQPQPTSRMCFVCGRENPVGLHIQFYEDEETGEVKVPLTIPERYQGYPGIVHGGILSTILDEVSGRAIMVGAEDDPFWVTAKMEVRYRQPTPTETPLLAVGWVVQRRRRSAAVAAEIRLENGTVTAEVESLVVCPTEETLVAWQQERMYWRVASEESTQT